MVTALRRVAWGLGTTACAAAGFFALFSGCSQELVLVHAFALVCCGACAVHCFTEMLK